MTTLEPDHPLVIVWAHSRSMSSATERAFIARGDLRVFHEPFVQSYYNTIDRDFPHRDPDADLFERYADARSALLGAADIGPVMAKDMAFYVIDEIRDDPAFRARVTPIVLFRDPRRAIPSYLKLDPDATVDEVGYEGQVRLLELLDADGIEAMVVEAETVQADPAAAFAAMFAFAGLEPAPDAVTWRDDVEIASWHHVRGWHVDALESTGIRPPADDDPDEVFAAGLRANPRAQALYDHHRPFYEQLRARAWAPERETGRG